MFLYKFRYCQHEQSCIGYKHQPESGVDPAYGKVFHILLLSVNKFKRKLKVDLRHLDTVTDKHHFVI